jgi:hypothetical protein
MRPRQLDLVLKRRIDPVETAEQLAVDAWRGTIQERGNSRMVMQGIVEWTGRNPQTLTNMGPNGGHDWQGPSR